MNATHSAIIRCCCLLLILAPVWTAEPAPSNDHEPVVVVGGEAITVRRLEDELLKREGADLVEKLLEESLPATPWPKLKDEDPVLVAPSGRITRRDLLVPLMAKHAEVVGGELLDSELVRAELVRKGITVDEALIRAEIERMRRRLGEAFAARGQPNMDLDSFLRQQKGMGIEDYVRQPGFRWLIAGLCALVRDEAAGQVGEAELRARFDRDPEAFRVPEACDCQAIHIPFKTEPGPDGTPIVTADERRRLEGVVDTLHRQVLDGKTSFGATFRLFARSYDPDADSEGRLGWVRRDGTRGKPRARVLAPEVVKAAFAVKGPFPFLLPPIAHADGVDVVRVLGWRPESPPDFAAARPRLLEQLVENNLEARKRALLERLRTTAKTTRGDDGSITAGAYTLTRRMIEDEVLAREGGKAAIIAAAKLVATIDWSAVGLDDDVVATAGWRLPRRGFATRLLGERGAAAREDLITLALIRQQLAREKIVVDNAAVEAEVQRLERAYRRSPEAAKRDFRAFVIESHGAPLETLRQDPAFRLLAGTALLVRRYAQLSDDELRVFLAENAEYYREPAAVDLSVLFLPFRPAQAGAAITAADRTRAIGAAHELHDALQNKGADFGRAWREFGKVNDPYAREGGRVGWIGRDGRRDHAEARVIPAEAVSAAFAAPGPFPALLTPVTHALGADLVIVHGRRETRDPSFAELRERLARDCLEADWDSRLTSCVDGLRRAATIDYRELGPLIAARRGTPPEPPADAVQGPAPDAVTQP